MTGVQTCALPILNGNARFFEIEAQSLQYFVTDGTAPVAGVSTANLGSLPGVRRGAITIPAGSKKIIVTAPILSEGTRVVQYEMLDAASENNLFARLSFPAPGQFAISLYDTAGVPFTTTIDHDFQFAILI